LRYNRALCRTPASAPRGRPGAQSSPTSSIQRTAEKVSRTVLLRWLHGFLPAPVSLKWTERLRAGAGALIGIALTGGVAHLLIGDASAIPFLIAPMGASAVLLFAVPASPLAQPWSIIGG